MFSWYFYHAFPINNLRDSRNCRYIASVGTATVFLFYILFSTTYRMFDAMSSPPPIKGEVQSLANNLRTSTSFSISLEESSDTIDNV